MYLITGSTGYIGNSLANLFISKGESYFCIERKKGFDLSQKGWSNYIPELNINTVFHLAQSNHYNEFPEKIEDIFSVNIASTLELLEWSRKNGVKRFIFCSSGNVYKETDFLLDESSLCEPSSMYGASKLAAEELIFQYRNYFEIVILRIFGVYGPNQTKMLIPNMIHRVNNGIEITLGQNAGLFITPLYIDDCINIMDLFGKTCIRSPFEIFNICGNEKMSLREIVDIIAEKIDKTPLIAITDAKPRSLCGDNKKLKEYYSGFIPFNNGIERTLIYANKDL